MRQTHKLFGDYEIIQDTRFLKLTQDTVLLSDFVRLKNNHRVFEFGVGVGNLSLLLLVKNANIITNGIEILPEAAKIAQENYEHSGVADRGNVLTGDLKGYKGDGIKYDVCVSNPPYFSATRGAQAGGSGLRTARSDGSADIYDICSSAKSLLKWRGLLCFCYKPERIGNAFDALTQNNFSVKRLQFVHQHANSAANLVLIEASYGGGEGCVCAPPIIVSLPHTHDGEL